MKKVSGRQTLLFTCAVAYGLFFGFWGSTIAFLSWIIAPIFGIALYNVNNRIPQNIPKFFYSGVLLGLLLGGLPVWTAITSTTQFSLSVKLILIFSTPLIVLAFIIFSSLFYKFKNIHTNTRLIA